jgi:hypothetical protein
VSAELHESIRFDAVKLTKVERTPEGYLRCDASIGRVGVFEYKRPDGSTRREYRPAEEVFAPESIASAIGKPATDLHPGLVTSKSVRALRVGGPLDTPRQDGTHLVVRMQIEDAPAVEAVEAGKRQDISSGYVVREDHTPGVHPVYGAYDLVQRQIRYNHFALLPPGAGRQGRDVALRLDAQQESSQACVIVLDANDTVCDTLDNQAPIAPAEEKKTMLFGTVEIKLDAKDEAVISAHVAKLEADKAAAESARAQIEAERDALKVRTDAADAAEAAAERKALEASASKVLGTSAKFDGKTDAQIRGEVVAKVYPGVKLDGKSDEYVSALFDQACVAKLPVVRQDGGPAAVAAVLEAGGAPAKDPRQEMIERRKARSSGK